MAKTTKKSGRKSVKKVSKKQASKEVPCGVCAGMNKRLKKLNACDISMIKLASASFILFVITAWPAAMNVIAGVHWGWWLAFTALFGIRPFVKAYL